MLANNLNPKLYVIYLIWVYI